ncbi:MAG: DUF6531 domain-containing protein, partial [Planctomycetota bacterium]|nr:DUF6531 domain-containing protein [Planctomycetota bacterium]
MDIAPASIELSLSVWVDPVELDQNSTNEETMFYYFMFPSVAELKDLGDGRYRTSVRRRVNFDATVDPPGFKPLIEWRFDNTARALHSPAVHSYADVGWHDVSAGPLNNPAEVQIETYRVRITSHTSSRNIVPEGEPITFEAVTEPSGYEDEITWISSTKYGTASPVLGRGPSFIVQFDDSWGRHGSGIGFQWLGVKADNTVFNQDQKNTNPNRCCCCDGTVAATSETIVCTKTSTKDDGGNSVYYFSGECFERAVDLRIRGRGLDFIWARKYRSRFGLDTVQGNGWDFSYNISLRQSGPNITVLEGNARTDLYLLQLDGTWTIKEAFRTLSQKENGSYTMTFSDTGRWDFHPFDGSPWQGRISAIVGRNGNTLSFDYDGQGRLVTIHDTLDNPPGNPREITIAYNDHGFIESVTDFFDRRQVRYEYYQEGDAGGSFGDLKSATTPAVHDTPTGNNFPDGKTTVYTYSKGFADEALNHNLLTITDPKGQTFATNTYGDSGFSFDRVTREVRGDPGDIIDFVYGPVEPSAENNFAISQVIMNDRVGDVKVTLVDAGNRTVIQREYTGRWDPDQPTTPEDLPTPDFPKLRNADPDFFETRWIRNDDALPLETTHPNGNVETFVYDEDNSDRRSQGNMLRHCREPGTHTPPGDQARICEDFEYEHGFGGCCGTNFITRHVDGRGNETLHTYDRFGNREHTQHRIDSIVEDFTYNQFGQMTSHTLPDNGSSHRRRDRFTYYEGGRQFGYRESQIIDFRGENLTTTFEYDRVGNMTRTIDPEGHDRQYVYNQ